MIKLRPGTEADHPFILSSWMNSYRSHGNHIYKPSGKVYRDGHEPKIKLHLQTCQVLVATTSEDETQIIGYIVMSPDCVHFCYVKNTFRKLGVGRELMRQAVGRTYYSQHSSYSKHITGALEYDPYRF